MIIVFGKEYCPYCQNAKKLLTEKENTYFPLEEERNQTLVEKLRNLELIPESHRTVPIVINYTDRNPRFIGGYDDLVKLLD
jgi:glutaredoxin